MPQSEEDMALMALAQEEARIISLMLAHANFVARVALPSNGWREFCLSWYRDFPPGAVEAMVAASPDAQAYLEKYGTKWLCANYAARDVPEQKGGYRWGKDPEMDRLPLCDCRGGCKAVGLVGT
jgi:hypothetical protein